MKGLKQTRLSFTPMSKKDSVLTDPSPSSESPSKTPKPKKNAQSTNGRSRVSAVELPPPPRRSSRAQAPSKPSATPTRTSPRKPAVKVSTYSPAQARIPSVKRKRSPDPGIEGEKEDAVHAPMLESSNASKTRQGTSSRIPSKKIRLSSPESDLTPLPSSSLGGRDPDELVPTSQSDEQELTLPRVPQRDPTAIQESVAKWRQETHANPPSRTQSPPPLDPIGTSLDDEPMDVESTPFEAPSDTSARPMQYPQTPRSSSDGSSHQAHLNAALATATRPNAPATPASQAQTPTRGHMNRAASPSDAFSTLTPPPSSDPISVLEMGDEAPVVQALDVKSKTEQLIADIKARAYAAAHSSPEQSPIDLDALVDSDSDSDSSSEDVRGGFIAALTRETRDKGKGKHSENSSKAGPSKPEPASTPRYNLRRASPSKAARSAVPAPTQTRKPRKTDPLDALLREKAREERTGTGMVAIRSAAAATAAARAKEEAKQELQDEMADDEDDDWGAGIAALGSAARGAKKGKASRTPMPNEGKGTIPAQQDARHGSESEDEDALTAIDCEAILGSKQGQAVGKILESDLRDKKARALAKLSEEPVGVPLWDATLAIAGEDGMDVDFGSTLPSFIANAGGTALFQLLEQATRNNDVAQVSALLASGFVAFLPLAQFAAVVPWLFETAFSDVPQTLSVLAYTQLMRLAPLSMSHSSGLRASLVLTALVRLGAPQTVLAQHGWAVTSGRASKIAYRVERRDEMTHRLVAIIGAFAQPTMGHELKEFFLTLLLIGMDPTTSDELVVEIHESCNMVARAMEVAQGSTFDVEASLCEKIVAFGKSLSPPNQSRLISLFPCTSQSTARMARNVSRALLMDTQPSSRAYEKLPDLLPVIDLLTPPVGSGAHFDVAGNAAKEGYYDALACRVSLLSRVLSDIDEYTKLEMQAAKVKAAKTKERLTKEGTEQKEDEEAKDEKEKDDTSSILDRIRRQLEELHGRIFDTRAAHLDRSRAKAAIQRLCLRVHYQRLATLKSGSGTGKARNIRTYFGASS